MPELAQARREKVPVMLTLAEKISPTTTALIVVDVQNDYANPEGALGRAGADLSAATEMLPRLERLVEEARRHGVLVVFTRNWHRPATDSAAWLDRLARSGSTPETRPGRADTWGAQIHRLSVLQGDEVVDKFRYDAFLGTNLEYLLRSRGVRTVAVTGTTTNVCVESTARSAHLRDFHVVLVGDCCASPEPELHRATLANVEGYFGEVADSALVVAAWEATREGDA